VAHLPRELLDDAVLLPQLAPHLLDVSLRLEIPPLRLPCTRQRDNGLCACVFVHARALRGASVCDVHALLRA
jgi:hypothetical protein